MTKYILHGGRTSIKSVDNELFFAECLKGLTNPKVLSVCFARDVSEWNMLLTRDRVNFHTEPTVASNDIRQLIEQINSADFIFIHGGTEIPLKKIFGQIPNLKSLFEGKVVAGTSAGALFLSKNYYCNDDDIFDTGLGILPINIITHYESNLKSKLEQLVKLGKGVKTYALPEGKFITLTS